MLTTTLLALAGLLLACRAQPSTADAIPPTSCVTILGVFSLSQTIGNYQQNGVMDGRPTYVSSDGWNLRFRSSDNYWYVTNPRFGTGLRCKNSMLEQCQGIWEVRFNGGIYVMQSRSATRTAAGACNPPINTNNGGSATTAAPVAPTTPFQTSATVAELPTSCVTISGFTHLAGPSDTYEQTGVVDGKPAYESSMGGWQLRFSSSDNYWWITNPRFQIGIRCKNSMLANCQGIWEVEITRNFYVLQEISTTTISPGSCSSTNAAPAALGFQPPVAAQVAPTSCVTLSRIDGLVATNGNYQQSGVANGKPAYESRNGWNLKFSANDNYWYITNPWFRTHVLCKNSMLANCQGIWEVKTHSDFYALQKYSATKISPGAC